MADKAKSGGTKWRGIPVALKVLALCLVALVALLVMLPPPPENDSGGVTTVTKHVPALRDTVDPLGDAPQPADQSPALPPAIQEPVEPPVLPAEEPAEPEVPETGSPETATAAPPQSPPSPGRKPAGETSSGPPATTTGQGGEQEQLPWQQNRDVARLPEGPSPDGPPPGEGELPSKSDIRGWVRSQAWEFLGGVDAEGNILYRFEVWLEPPPGTLGAIKAVSYDYDAPSATPRTQESNRQKGGFRVRLGSLACAKKIMVTVTMADGRSRSAVVDGCAALN